jgi:hypothetical protein
MVLIPIRQNIIANNDVQAKGFGYSRSIGIVYVRGIIQMLMETITSLILLAIDV